MVKNDLNNKEKNMDFEKRVDNAIREMGTLGYEPIAFIRMRIKDGTIAAIKRLVNDSKIADGFTRLCKLKRLDLSMENIIQEEAWQDLFSEEDRVKARKKLSDYGYNVAG